MVYQMVIVLIIMKMVKKSFECKYEQGKIQGEGIYYDENENENVILKCNFINGIFQYDDTFKISNELKLCTVETKWNHIVSYEYNGTKIGPQIAKWNDGIINIRNFINGQCINDICINESKNRSYRYYHYNFIDDINNGLFEYNKNSYVIIIGNKYPISNLNINVEEICNSIQTFVSSFFEYIEKK